MNLIAKNLSIPFFLRAMEAISTSMLIGGMMGGINLVSPLGMVYAFHWICSANFHLFPSIANFYVDVLFIDLVGVERLSYFLDTDVLHPFFALLLLTNVIQYHPLLIYVKTTIIVCRLWMVVEENLSVHYVLSWLYCGLFYAMSDVLLRYGLLRSKVVVHTIFHFSLGYNSFLEVPYYRNIHQQQFTLFRLGTYGVYAYKGWSMICQE